MENTPLVSIIIPCYNREKYISDAINSVLNQSYSNIEIIVVDDGSTDQSVSIVSKYHDQVKLIVQPNGGVNSARNRGFAESSGEYVIFLDSDDWFSPNLVEQHIATSQKFPNVSIYCSDAVFVDQAGQQSEVISCNWPDKPDRPIELFLLNPPPFPACEMYKRAAVEENGGYDEAMLASADSDLRLRIVLNGGLVIKTPGAYAVYRTVENSITKNHRKVHKYGIILANKLISLYAQNDQNLMKLLNRRLFVQRMRWWNTFMKVHFRLSPLSIVKFSRHLIRVIIVDPGYVNFLIKGKPWKQT